MKNIKSNKLKLLKCIQGDYNVVSLCSIKHKINEFEFINKTTNKVEKAKLKIKYLPDLDRLVFDSLLNLIDSYAKEKTDLETAVEEIFELLFECLSPVELLVIGKSLKNEKISSKVKFEYSMFENGEDWDEEDEDFYDDEEFEDDFENEEELEKNEPKGFDKNPVLSLFNTNEAKSDIKEVKNESDQDLLQKKDKSKNSKKPKK